MTLLYRTGRSALCVIWLAMPLKITPWKGSIEYPARKSDDMTHRVRDRESDPTEKLISSF